MKKFKLNIIILVLFSSIVMYFSLKDDFSTVISYILKSNLAWLLVAVIFMLLNILFQSISLYLFIKKIDKKYKFSFALKLTAAGLLFNAITPFSSGGQPFQIYMLKKQGIRISDSTNILLQNFITYQLSLIFIGTIAVILNYSMNIFPSSSLLKKVVLLGYLVNVLVLFLIVFFLFAKKVNTKLFNKIIDFIFKFKFIKNKEEKREKLTEMLENFYNGSVSLKNNLDVFFKSMLFNTLSLICLYILPLFIFYSMGEAKSITIIKSLVASGYTYLIGSFVPIPGGTGGLEYGFIEFFKTFKSGSFISAAMLIWRFITYYLGMIIGMIALLISKKEDEEE